MPRDNRRLELDLAALECGAWPHFPNALNEQIGRELAASQQYVAIAVYYDAETLPQLAQHFYRQAVEERNHAMMIVQYLLDAGEDVRIPGVAEPQNAFADAVAPIRLALEQEKRVTEDIVDARQARARGGRPRRRAVPALVPPGAARGGREHVVAAAPWSSARRTTCCWSRSTSPARAAAAKRPSPSPAAAGGAL